MKKFETINPLFRAGLELQDALSKRQWAFCYIGGLAVIRWGELRMTQDIDICLLCGFGNEEQYKNASQHVHIANFRRASICITKQGAVVERIERRISGYFAFWLAV